jgi:two-component system, OmpR family, sensor histidine kinase ChvG
MVSDTVTANPELKVRRARREPVEGRAATPRPSGWPLGSRLGRLIIFLNLLSLAILVGGALVLNELRQGLVDARLEGLMLEGQVIANVIDQSATVGDPEPALEADTASNVLQALFDTAHFQRARLYDVDGHVIFDSRIVADRVEASPLPAVAKPGHAGITFGLGAVSPSRQLALAHAALTREVARALRGDTVSNVRIGEDGRKIVSVSIPIEHVREVLGVLTLDAGDVEQIIAAERVALIPFILMAVGVSLLSSLLMTTLIARPVLRLARAADRVRLQRSRAIALPDLARRGDELGDLTRSLEDMTHTLSDRMEAIEAFAADVAHELRNPMTSIRSAVETLELVKDAAPRARLLAILQQDVGRLDRLITDISNASRLDAELARESPRPLDLARLLADICSFYEATAKPGEPRVRFTEAPSPEPMRVSGREGPLGQVIRNLVDNARSFSPKGGEVRVSVRRGRGEIVAQIDDDGPGMPPENLETVFERFYTSRPRGAAFGGNSGLGLAIARQIVEAHGGRIRAENRLKDGAVAGARFVVALPSA